MVDHKKRKKKKKKKEELSISKNVINAYLFIYADELV